MISGRSKLSTTTLTNDLSQIKLRKIHERLDGLGEMMEILADGKTLSSVRKSLADIKEGRYVDYPLRETIQN